MRLKYTGEKPTILTDNNGQELKVQPGQEFEVDEAFARSLIGYPHFEQTNGAECNKRMVKAGKFKTT